MANFRVQLELVGRIMSLQKDELQLVQLMDKVKKGGKSDFVLFVLGYGHNIQSDWNINAAEFKIFLSLNPPRITCVS